MSEACDAKVGAGDVKAKLKPKISSCGSGASGKSGGRGRGSGSSANALVTANNGAMLSLFPPGYGFVVLTALGSVGLVTWKSMKVGIAREEFKIPYPQMYSTDCMAFNCVLRAHHNTLESYPQFLLMLLIGGFEMPYFCTLGGCIWILGRVMYAKGYYSGDPSQRSRGTVSIVGMVMLLAATAKFALKHLRG